MGPRRKVIRGGGARPPRLPVRLQRPGVTRHSRRAVEFDADVVVFEVAPASADDTRSLQARFGHPHSALGANLERERPVQTRPVHRDIAAITVVGGSKPPAVVPGDQDRPSDVPPLDSPPGPCAPRGHQHRRHGQRRREEQGGDQREVWNDAVPQHCPIDDQYTEKHQAPRESADPAMVESAAHRKPTAAVAILRQAVDIVQVRRCVQSRYAAALQFQY